MYRPRFTTRWFDDLICNLNEICCRRELFPPSFRSFHSMRDWFFCIASGFHSKQERSLSSRFHHHLEAKGNISNGFVFHKIEKVHLQLHSSLQPPAGMLLCKLKHAFFMHQLAWKRLKWQLQKCLDLQIGAATTKLQKNGFNWNRHDIHQMNNTLTSAMAVTNLTFIKYAWMHRWKNRYHIVVLSAWNVHYSQEIMRYFQNSEKTTAIKLG